MKRIGLLGGTFDPPHLGHLLIAQEALERCELDQIWFLPSYIPPHKNRKVTDSHHRIEMVRKAIHTNPSFQISLIEIERRGKSYTVDTLRQLKHAYPEYEFFFIIGADMIRDLPNWHKIDELCQLTSFIGFRRPGYIAKHPLQAQVHMIDMPQIEISSSDIRNRLKHYRSCMYLLNEEVKDYIKENHLYED
ncbi:nicotinate-nucleotide adenylyltransferase [Terrilactibacillus sp. BCM23-1]|uniref:Probable nicotinate-nucleotide adenylyltransferase n=1 Tax=Terrilactibacillus tamarindi TaxID=2599694 RepID=A0A6N8CVU0_9BACI|nr:nicotinate-nucleotide adenylyltransferase [Terrilactibacillus tamarindi]MTT32486.1 nicotinate-nucleotide adenylyltransferase [Terrilactibacillus tamarindi]